MVDGGEPKNVGGGGDREDVKKLKEVAHDLGERELKKEEEARRASQEAEELKKEKSQVEEVIHEIEDHDHGNEGFSITASVNTQRLEMVVHPDEPIEAVRARALKDTNNLAQPPEKWDVKTETDQILNVSLTVAQAGIIAGAVIFISLQAGAAGA